MISAAKKAEAQKTGIELSKQFTDEIEASGLSAASQAALGVSEFKCGIVVLGLAALPNGDGVIAARILADHITRLVAAAFPPGEEQS